MVEKKKSLNTITPNNINAEETLVAIGLMSGTSLDGVDAAIIKTDGNTIQSIGESITYPYSPHVKNEIRKVISESGDEEATEKTITEIHAQAVELLLQKAGLTAQHIDVIGFHGQTIYHNPDLGITKQIGDAKLLAKTTSIDVVNDFRSADIEHGGQGAPLVPLYHIALVKEAPHPIAILNIGGVANVSWISENKEIIAFDTGPGNALIDDWVLEKLDKPFDDRGTVAAKGNIKSAVLDKLLTHSYFSQEPPKSLDRNTFLVDDIKELSVEDGAATLVEFTAKTVAMSEKYFPRPVKQWLVSGGGRHNLHLMERLSCNVSAPLHAIEVIECDGDAIEAQAFAYLAVRSLKKLPLSLPSTTGVSKAVTGGVLSPA